MLLLTKRYKRGLLNFSGKPCIKRPGNTTVGVDTRDRGVC